MANDKNSVDLEKLSNSLKVIGETNNSLNNASLSNIVLDLDADLNKISFEHGNCFKDCKDSIDSLTKELDVLKREVNELNIALEKTVNSFSDIEKDVSFRKTDMLLNEVTKIPDVSTETNTEVQQKEPINTIPVGLGIAASGIAGSVGAVVVDSMIGPTPDPIPEYDDTPIEIVEKKQPEREEDDSIAHEEKFDDVTPYHASRDKEVIDKFYDEQDN